MIDPDLFAWHDSGWHGVPLAGQVIDERHLGTLTPAETWEAASRALPEWAAVGITVLEIRPIADFPGRFGWGDDGVNRFAPTRLSGTPDDCRRFVDRPQALGLAVILDVVENPVGPDGNDLGRFSPESFSARYTTDWGEAINFDDEYAGPVRAFFFANAGYWVDEFHLDGLRLDATQTIYDRSVDHILAAIGRAVRQLVRQGHVESLRRFLSIAQPEMQARLPDPADPETFARSKLDFSERQRHAEIYTLHCDLLRLRREDPVFRAQHPGGMDGAVLGSAAFVLRFFGGENYDRLLVVNLGRDLPMEPAPEPLLAPPQDRAWTILWSSEDPRYGGSGTALLEDAENWHMPGHAAVVLRPKTCPF